MGRKSAGTRKTTAASKPGPLATSLQGLEPSEAVAGESEAIRTRGDVPIRSRPHLILDRGSYRNSPYRATAMASRASGLTCDVVLPPVSL